MRIKPSVKSTKSRKTTKAQGPTTHPVFLYLLLAVPLLGLFYQRTLSGDVWWHLKTGQWIVGHHALPRFDPFSFTATRAPVLHEWAWEVVSWLVYSRVSHAALAYLSIALMTGAFLVTFGLALARSRNALASFIVIALSASASAFVSEMRPQVFACLMFALFVAILERYQRRRTRAIWLLVPMTVIWANFHGGVVSGIALLAAEVAILAISPPGWAREHERPRLRAVLPMLGVFLAVAVAALVNPGGSQVYLHPITIMSHPATSSSANGSPSFQDRTGRLLLVMLGAWCMLAGFEESAAQVPRFRIFRVCSNGVSGICEKHCSLFHIVRRAYGHVVV